MTTKKIDLETSVLNLEPAPLAATATVTRRLPGPELRRRIRAMLMQSDTRDDAAIVTIIRRRDASDSGERIPLEQFMRGEGYNPADFGF